MAGYPPGLDTMQVWPSTDPENPPQSAAPARSVEQQWKKASLIPPKQKTGHGTDSRHSRSITEIMSDNYCLVCVVTVVTLLALCLAGYILAMVFGMPNRHYSVTIDSVSGLDLPPSKDLVLNPQFNLTLRLALASPGRRACIDAGTFVQVSYRCVPLATSAATPRRLCVGPKRSRDELVIAKGTGVRLPGFLVDSLAADFYSSVEAFDVMLRRSAGHDDNTLVASCGVRRVGGVGARCDLDETCPVNPARTMIGATYRSDLHTRMNPPPV